MTEKELERAQLGVLLNDLGLTGVGAEVGVYIGAHAYLLLRRWKGKKLICVDAWTLLQPNPGIDETKEKRARENLHRYVQDGRCEIVKSLSTDAAATYPDGHFDFVYIDAGHDYDSVYADLKAWYPKVKDGGLFAGHDFGNPKHPDVKRAVLDFVDGEIPHLHVDIVNKTHPEPEWMVQKCHCI